MNKGREQLLKEHRRTIRVANVLSVVGGILGLLCYWSGWLSANNWRGFGLGAGLVALLPLAYMVVTSVPRGGEAVKECLVAYAIAGKAPAGLLFGIMGLMIIGGIASAVSLFR